MKTRVASLLLLLAVIFSGCAPQLSDANIQGTVQIVIALTALAQTGNAPTSTLAAEATLAPSETSEPPTETPHAPVVVFIDIGGDAEAQIRARVVEPYILYHRDLADYPRLVSLTIETIPDVPGYPYKAEAIFETGITNGWLISVQGGNVDWWLPECFGDCVFSDAFRNQYPEIVATMEP